jgi:IMP dehydrogenase
MSDLDKILLMPRPSSVNSREEVSLETSIGNIKVSMPIIASPMKGIVDPKFISLLSDYGILGILHRFYSTDEEWITDVRYLRDNANLFGISFGLQSNDSTIKFALDQGAKVLCLDVANGYLDSVLNRCETIADIIYSNNYSAYLMSGNVVTDIGVLNLRNSGVDLVRVGIGTGALCTTRIVTGVGYPQTYAIRDCSKVDDIKIVADGGIKTSGDIMKALALGADFVMIGSLFGTAYESASNSSIYGMASKRIQEQYYDSIKSVEGIEVSIKQKRPLSEILHDLAYGLKSACTYLDCYNINSIQTKVNIIWL